MHSRMFGPVVVLVAWTLVMWIWLYVTRLPAMRRAGVKLDPNAPRGEQMAKLPPRVRWKADNYDHLMEQPTLFYAVAIVIALVGAGEHGWAPGLAWGYVGSRVVHSVVQATWNRIEARFVVFTVGTAALMGLTVIALRATVLA